MWVAEGDLSGVQANPWWLLGIAITVFGGIATTWIMARRPERAAPTAAEPVATSTAEAAVEEYKQLFMVPMREMSEQQRVRIEELEREVQLAERAQAHAERDAAAANAELAALRPAYHKALRDLAEERRRTDDR